MIEPTSGVFDGRDHLLPVRVYYEDTDFSGFVYHASHLKFFERGRTDFLRSIGVSHSALLAEGLGLVVRRMEIDWRRPAVIDDALVVRTRRLCFRSRPGNTLLVSTLELVALALAIPWLPYVDAIGFVPLPPTLLLVLVAITAAYVVAAEAMKTWFYRQPG